MKKITLIAAAVAALGVSAQASAFTASTIQFDLNGGAPGGLISVDTFDWKPGNALAKDAINTIDGKFTTYFQATLNSFLFDNNGAGDSFFPLVGTEFTVQAVIQEQGTNIGFGTASFVTLGGSYKIFYDASKDSNDITGLGYGLDSSGSDARLILEGSILPNGSGSFANNTINQGLPIVQLDTFGTDNQPGVLSVQGGGRSTINVDVTFIDTAFFKSNVESLIVDLNETTNLAAPFAQANPSDEVVGQIPNYGYVITGVDADGIPIKQLVNGASCGDSSQGVTCDFHFQSDSASSFARTVPEPGSLAIAGAGLALMSLIRRRKSK